MTSDDVVNKLSTLTPRQREVLALFCDGLTYKEIGRRLHIEEPTVKTHMGNIFIKLGLDHLNPAERRRRLRDEYCPALRESDHPTEEFDDQEELVPVSKEIEKMVEDDENALVEWQPQPIVTINAPKEERSTTRLRSCVLVLVGLILGALVTAGVFFLFVRNRIDGEAFREPIALIATTQAAEATAIMLSTPESILHTTTPVVEIVPHTVVVVVTATSPPSTDTPVATNTPLPTTTPTATATSLPTDTSPGTVLEEGQTWYQNGLALTAKDFCIVRCLPESFEVTFVLESFLDQDILLPEILGEDVSLEFDTGETYLPWVLGIATINNIPSQTLQPHRPLEWTWEYREDWNPNWWKPIGGETRDFSLVVKRIGERIVNAQWSGEIPR